MNAQQFKTNIAVILFSFLVAKTCKSQVIEWKEDFKLEWGHFKAPTQPWKVAAATYCGITLKPDNKSLWKGKRTYKAIAEFTCDSSFYFANRVSPTVLNHEQLHFDIAELFARKMRKRLYQDKFVTPSEAQKVFDLLYKEYIDFQTKLEEETESGAKQEEELKWEEIVSSELKELREFK